MWHTIKSVVLHQVIFLGIVSIVPTIESNVAQIESIFIPIESVLITIKLVFSIESGFLFNQVDFYYNRVNSGDTHNTVFGPTILKQMATPYKANYIIHRHG